MSKKEEKTNEKDKEKGNDKEKKGDANKALDDSDINLLKRYGRGPYFEPIRILEEEVKEYSGKIDKLIGVKESDTGLSAPSEWFLTVLQYFIYREIKRCLQQSNPSS